MNERGGEVGARLDPKLGQPVVGGSLSEGLGGDTTRAGARARERVYLQKKTGEDNGIQ